MPPVTPSTSAPQILNRCPQCGAMPAGSVQQPGKAGPPTSAQDTFSRAQPSPSASRASAAAPPPAASANTSTSTTTSKEFVAKCLEAALNPRPGHFQPDYVGGEGKIKLWTDQKVAQLALGIDAARQFYPEIEAADLGRLIIAEGAQETTGDWNLKVGGDKGAGQGFMQVTPQSVVRDYVYFGQAIRAPNGALVVDPDQPIDLANVGQNVALWAWYTRNCVAAGQALDERLIWKNPPTNVVRDFGNAQLTWLAGPHNDRHTSTGADSYEHYYRRIRDYFVLSKFGDDSKLRGLLDTQLSDQLLLTRVRPGLSAATWKG